MQKSKIIIVLSVLVFSGSCTLVNNNLPDSTLGSYKGDLVVKALPDGRTLELVQDFEFVAPNNVKWVVPKRAKVDGASIPKPLWSTIGGPFSGKYRDASVVHDFYCDVRIRTSNKVHRVFYDAMLASGVEKSKADVMYFAVLRFGPKWDGVSRKYLCKGDLKPEELGLTADELKICNTRSARSRSVVSVEQVDFNQQEFLAAKKLIESGKLKPEEIERLANAPKI